MHNPVNDPHNPVNRRTFRLPQLCIKNMTLEKKKIVVAGGSSGIGLALTQQLMEEKAMVTVLGRNPDKLAALRASHPEVNTVALDARDRNALDDFFKNNQPIDHLVLALSGSKGGGPFRTLPLGELQEGFDNKFWPQLQTLQAALPYLPTSGSVTFITAISATAQMPGSAGLAAINGALEIMVPILSKELKPLRVNAVSPGVIDTPWWDFLPADAKNQVFADFSSRVSVGRIGRPEEVAAIIRSVITNEYINGAVIGCHGGLS
jgi:NAD(P)-dependent dehydrogenase (short-subunit alcohol dehydrogenase family)